MTDTHIGNRIFTLDDQCRFAAFSGDRNPIHLDDLAARRTIAGEVVVHGVHIIMWALDRLHAERGIRAQRIRARFLKPVFLNEEVSCYWNPDRATLTVCLDEIRLVAIKLTPADDIRPAAGVSPAGPGLDRPADSGIESIRAGERYPLILHGDGALAEKMFRDLCRAYGRERARDLAATSEIVGMQLPGLHSFFLSLDVVFEGANPEEPPFFEVKSVEQRFRMIDIGVTTASLTGTLSALQRAAPVNAPAMADIGKHVQPGEFSSAKALVVGGSRGLGEVTAKLIAAGGGEVHLTYNRGKTEAERIVDEISAYGGKACSLQHDVQAGHFAGREGINQLYYFATPKIFGKRPVHFISTVYRQFMDIYVHGFLDIVDAQRLHPDPLKIFYPSTVAIDEPVPGLEEYVAAKLAAEKVCEALDQEKTLSVIQRRLPRIETDQTASVVAAPAEDAIEVLLPIIRSMQG